MGGLFLIAKIYGSVKCYPTGTWLHKTSELLPLRESCPVFFQGGFYILQIYSGLFVSIVVRSFEMSCSLLGQIVMRRMVAMARLFAVYIKILNS